jgi:signal transduction histidine kinase
MSLMSEFTAGLRFRLLLLGLLACAPLLALMLHTAGEDRRRQMFNWQQHAYRISHIAQQEEEEILGGTRQLLLAVAESTAVRSGNHRACKKLVDDLFASYPRYANLGVISPAGDVLASALPLAAPTNQTDRRFFRRTIETRAFAVGEFPSKRITGKPTLDFGYPVLDASGEVEAVVFASLDLRWFARFGSQIPSQLPKGSTWMEIDPSGIILGRYPASNPDDWLGRALPEAQLLKTIHNSSEGAIETADPNGVPSYYAFVSIPSPLAGGSAATILSIPKQMLFAQADHLLHRNLTWLGIAALLAFTLGWLGSKLLILQPVKALVSSTARLAAGDLTVRTGLPYATDELGQLAHAFDQMAQSIEDREKERERASHNLQAISHRLVEVQESERRHIARELHDEIGQTLTSAEMNLQAALRAPRSSALEQRLQDSLQAVERVLEQVHDLSLSLRPSMLDDLGLEPALRWYTQRQAALAGLAAEFHAESMQDRMDPMIETECFRVAQEALNNVVRHARAHAVAVNLSRLDGQLHLRVRDNGVGFNVAVQRSQAVRGASLGLLSMEERAALAGGGIEYHSVEGHGTEIHAWFPLKPKDTPALAQFNE